MPMKLSLYDHLPGRCLAAGGGKSHRAIVAKVGHEVDFPADQTCCGQPFYNSGYADLARQQARHTIGVFAGERTVVVPSGNLAAMVKVEYPHLLADEPEWHARAVQLAGRTFELADFLVNQLGVVDVGARFEGKIAYHYACHLRGLGLAGEVEQLIRHVQVRDANAAKA